MRHLLKIILLFLVSTPLFSIEWNSEDEISLSRKDIPTVMENIFSLHIEEQALSPKIMGRAIKSYVEQFDPSHSYLTEEEVAPYYQPSDALLEQALTEYYEHKYTLFDELDNLFYQAVERKQKIRKQLLRKLSSPFAPSEAVSISDAFPKTEKGIKEKTRKEIENFIYVQNKLIGTNSDEIYEKILALYEKQMHDEEYLYLHQTAYATEQTPEEREHFQTLHILKALSNSLDSHTAYFSPTEAYEMRLRLEKDFHGLGILLQETIDGVVITRLVEDGPAARSGYLEAGDRIIAIDGTNIVELPFKEVLTMIRGEKLSPIDLGIKRLIDDKEVEFTATIIRDHVVITDDRVDTSFEPYGDGIIGKIVLHSFYEGENGISSEEDVRAAIEELQRHGELKGLVLDLRYNSGGFLQQAVKVAGLFISSGVVVISKYSNETQKYFRDMDGQAFYDGPLIVLTSKASASAAEIVAQSLQDYGVALVIGDKRTYGKGSIQHQTITSGEAPLYFKVTVGRYYTTSGKSTQIHGVQADIEVPTPYSAEEIGEEYLEYPLEGDIIAGAFQDPLSDIAPSVQPWFSKYYTPSIQQPTHFWRNMLPTLQSNSSARISNDPNYLLFMEKQDITPPEEPDMAITSAIEELSDKENFGSADLQMAEAVNIVKDMIVLSQSSYHYNPVASETPHSFPVEETNSAVQAP